MPPGGAGQGDLPSSRPPAAAATREVPLTGGNTSTGVVRVGDTVRKPAGPWTPAVHALLEHLHDVGLDSAPRSLGLDDQGRHVLEHVPGEVHAGPADPARFGRLLRELHDACATFVPPPDARWDVVIAPDAEDLVVHHDAAPWNLVRGDRWALVDGDGAGPGSRTWDLAYAAHGVVPLAASTPLATARTALVAMADGYGLDEAGRVALAAALHRRVLSMWTLLHDGHRTGTEPWARLWREGHGDVWSANAAWVAGHEAELRSALLG